MGNRRFDVKTRGKSARRYCPWCCRCWGYYRRHGHRSHRLSAVCRCCQSYCQRFHYYGHIHGYIRNPLDFRRVHYRQEGIRFRYYFQWHHCCHCRTSQEIRWYCRNRMNRRCWALNCSLTQSRFPEGRAARHCLPVMILHQR